MVGSKKPYAGKGQQPQRRQKVTLAQCAFVLCLEFHSTAVIDVTVLLYFTFFTKKNPTYIYETFFVDEQLREK